MARKPKSVYERIEEKRIQIALEEERMAVLRYELKELELEKDDLEMHQLFDAMKNKGMNIEEALSAITKKK